MTDRPRLAWGARSIGATAGLAPALAAFALFIVLGGALNGDAMLPLAALTVIAVASGSLLGPRAGGSSRTDLRAMVAYALVGTFAYLLIGTLASVWTDAASGGIFDAGALATRIAGQILYGLLFLPLWAGAVAPFALVWVIAVRVLRQSVWLRPVDALAREADVTATQMNRISPRRMGLFATAVIVAYGLFVAVLPLVLYNDPRPPWWIDRPISLFSLFVVPAVVAAIGALRGVGPLLAAAGVICLLQAYIAFSGVTIGFVVPAVVLLWAGSAGSTMEMPPGRVAFVAGIIVIVMTVAAWVALLSLTEPRCWTGEQAANGTINTVEVPATDATLNGPIEVSSGGGGCSSAELTFQGMGVSAVLAIGAIAVAAVATSGGRKTDSA